MFAGAAFMLALAVGERHRGHASVIDMALYAAPFLAIVGLLLSGRYVGEERILAVYRTQPRPRRRKRRAALAQPPNCPSAPRSSARRGPCADHLPASPPELSRRSAASVVPLHASMRHPISNT